MIDLLNAVTTGGSVVAGMKALATIEKFFENRKNGNGNGRSSHTDMLLRDHDTLLGVKIGVEQLHEDLEQIRDDFREALRGRIP